MSNDYYIMEPLGFQGKRGQKHESCRYRGRIRPVPRGHARQIARARELGAQAVAVCMSADVTQRGGAALLPPAVRARAALAAGRIWAGAAEPLCLPFGGGLCRGGVALLSAVPELDTLVFGAETPDAGALLAAARRCCALGSARRWPAPCAGPALCGGPAPRRPRRFARRGGAAGGPQQ